MEQVDNGTTNVFGERLCKEYEVQLKELDRYLDDFELERALEERSWFPGVEYYDQTELAGKARGILRFLAKTAEDLGYTVPEIMTEFEAVMRDAIGVTWDKVFRGKNFGETRMEEEDLIGKFGEFLSSRMSESELTNLAFDLIGLKYDSMPNIKPKNGAWITAEVVHFDKVPELLNRLRESRPDIFYDLFPASEGEIDPDRVEIREMMTNPNLDRLKADDEMVYAIYKGIKEKMSVAKLEELCFRAGTNPEDVFKSFSVEGRLRELLEYFAVRRNLTGLFAEGVKMLPDFAWPTVDKEIADKPYRDQEEEIRRLRMNDLRDRIYLGYTDTELVQLGKSIGKRIDVNTGESYFEKTRRVIIEIFIDEKEGELTKIVGGAGIDPEEAIADHESMEKIKEDREIFYDKLRAWKKSMEARVAALGDRDLGSFAKKYAEGLRNYWESEQNPEIKKILKRRIDKLNNLLGPNGNPRRLGELLDVVEIADKTAVRYPDTAKLFLQIAAEMGLVDPKE